MGRVFSPLRRESFLLYPTAMSFSTLTEPGLHGSPRRLNGWNFILRVAIMPGAGVGSEKLRPHGSVRNSVFQERP